MVQACFFMVLCVINPFASNTVDAGTLSKDFEVSVPSFGEQL
jgi:hypothetical protein